MSNISLSVAEVKKIAKMSQLHLSESDVLKFQEQLTEVLNYVDVLNELDTENIKPTSQVTGLENVTRNDEIKNSLSADDALSGASEIEKKMFATKAVFNNNDES